MLIVMLILLFSRIWFTAAEVCMQIRYIVFLNVSKLIINSEPNFPSLCSNFTFGVVQILRGYVNNNEETSLIECCKWCYNLEVECSYIEQNSTEYVRRGTAANLAAQPFLVFFAILKHLAALHFERSAAPCFGDVSKVTWFQ